MKKSKEPIQVAIYVRVSSPDQVDNFSLEAQEQAAREYVRAHGWLVYRVYADEGYSARTADRPAFRMMLRDSRLRRFDLILVHKLDRFYRNLGQLLKTVQQLDRREVRLVSIREDIDFSSASGRMLLTSIGMISEFYSNNLREETAKGKRQRALNGLWNSCIPFGYKRGECTACADPNHKGACPNAGPSGICPGQMMVPHPRDSIGLHQAFGLHAQGKTYQEVADFLNAQGYRPPKRAEKRSLGRFGKETVRSMLQNETYLGFVKYRGELYPGQHPPLVARKLFERSQQVRRDASVVRQHPTRKRHYLLSGLIRCERCGYVMRGVAAQGGARFYRDAGRERGVDCSQKRVQAERVEDNVAAVLARLKLPGLWRERIAQLAQATPAVEALEKECRILRSRGRRLRKLFLRGDIPEKQYERQYKQLQNQDAQLQSRIAGIDEQSRHLMGSFKRLWKQLTPVEQKRVAQAVIRAVYVRDEEVVRIEFHRSFAALV